MTYKLKSLKGVPSKTYIISGTQPGQDTPILNKILTFDSLIKILNIRCYIESMHSNIPKWGSNDQFWVLFRGMPPPLTMCHLMIWSQICILKMMSLLPLNGAWHFPLLKGVIYPHAILKVWWSYNVWARYVLEMESSARSTIGWTENTISLYSTLWIDNSEHNI